MGYVLPNTLLVLLSCLTNLPSITQHAELVLFSIAKVAILNKCIMTIERRVCPVYRWTYQPICSPIKRAATCFAVCLLKGQKRKTEAPFYAPFSCRHQIRLTVEEHLHRYSALEGFRMLRIESAFDW